MNFPIAEPPVQTPRSTLNLLDGWWVSVHGDAARLAAHGRVDEANALADLEENRPQCIHVSDTVNGLMPQYGKRMLDGKLVPSQELTHARILQVPADWAGARIFLTLDNTKYRVRAWIDEVLVAEYRGGMEPHRIDVTAYLKAGAESLIVVEVGDAGLSGHREFDTYSFTGTRLPTCGEIENNLVHPVVYGGMDRCLGLVSVEAMPPVRTDFVFCDPKVERGELVFLARVVNDRDREVTVRVRSEVPETKLLLDEEVTLAAGASRELRAVVPWPDAILWDTDHPHLYEVRTTLTGTDGPLDLHEDRFGFREFAIRGHSFYLNGKKIHLFGQSGHMEILESVRLPLEEKIEILRLWKAEGNINHVRLHAKPQERDWVVAADHVGMLITTETALWTTNFHSFDWVGSEEACYENVRNHFLEALVRRDRNSPSVIIWSLSNEMSPIIPADLEQPKMAAMTRIFDRIIAEAREEDASRVIQMSSAMDFLGRLDVYNLHYPKNWQAFPDYPRTAYWLDDAFLFPWYGARRLEMPSWTWRRDKPLVFGEFSCIFGATPDNQASIVGDRAFEQEDFGCVLVQEKIWPMEIRAYRKQDVSGFTAWSCMDFHSAPSVRKTLERPDVAAHTEALRPLAVLNHSYTSRWFGGDEAVWDLSIHNDTRRTHTLAARCELLDGDCLIASVSQSEREYEPAGLLEFQARFRLPARTCQLRLRVTLSDESDLVDQWETAVAVTARSDSFTWPQGAAVYDPDGLLTERFEAIGLTGVRVVQHASELEKRDAPKTLWIPFRAGGIPPREWRAMFPALRAFVQRGGTIFLDDPPDAIVSDLPVELKNGQGFAEPGDRLEITYAYPVADQHPGLRGLCEQDFCLWGKDFLVARRCFAMPEEGNFRPLLLAGTDRSGLSSSPLIELPEGCGSWMVSSLEVTPKLTEDPQCARILLGLLGNTGEAPVALERPSVLCSASTDRIFQEIGLFASEDSTTRIQIIDGAELGRAGDLDAVRGRLETGGSLLLHDLEVGTCANLLKTWDLPGKVRPWSDASLTDTFVHEHPLADGMTNNYLYWISNKKALAAWTKATIYSGQAGALIELPAGCETAWSLTRRGAVTAFSVGRGLLVIDNLRWQADDLEEPERARRYLATLLTNLGVLLSRGHEKRSSEDFETEAERRERGHF